MLALYRYSTGTGGGGNVVLGFPHPSTPRTRDPGNSDLVIYVVTRSLELRRQPPFHLRPPPPPRRRRVYLSISLSLLLSRRNPPTGTTRIYPVGQPFAGRTPTRYFRSQLLTGSAISFCVYVYMQIYMYTSIYIYVYTSLSCVDKYLQADKFVRTTMPLAVAAGITLEGSTLTRD